MTAKTDIENTKDSNAVSVESTDLFDIPVARELKSEWNEKMPCGHLRQYGTLGEVFPVHCLACENAKLRATILAVSFYAYQPAAVRAVIDDLSNDQAMPQEERR